jgi:hypothetical protein
VLAEAKAAGGTILKPAVDTSWGGYNGYFADLDGHTWEIAWEPGLPARRRMARCSCRNSRELL